MTSTNEETCSPCALRGVAPVMVCGDDDACCGWRDLPVWSRLAGLHHTWVDFLVGGDCAVVPAQGGMQWWLQ
jgi:hypothetical protein